MRNRLLASACVALTASIGCGSSNDGSAPGGRMPDAATAAARMGNGSIAAATGRGALYVLDAALPRVV